MHRTVTDHDDTHRFAHRRILASAGSGKTYQLASRYLGLVQAGAAPGSILATTFTRAAAGDIRDQLLRTAAEAVVDSEKRAALAERLDVEVFTRDQVINLLDQLTSQLHRLQIRTLDSLFAGVARSFALELQLPLDSSIVEEDELVQLRAEAIRLMLDEQDTDSLVTLLRSLTLGATTRSVTWTIDRTVSSLYELYRQSSPEAWECIREPVGELDPPQLVRAIQQLESYDIAKEPERLQKPWLADVQQARAHDWPNFLGKGLAAKFAAGQIEYNRTKLSEHLRAVYQPVVQHAQAVLVRRIRDQTLATRDLLAMFARHYEQTKRRRRAISFTDLTDAMQRAEMLGALDDIYFRLDGQLHHLLFDEFQDTSIPQWRALEPFVREVVSWAPPERTFFCVGDVKQSIYGWRDAAPEVMDELPALLAGPDGSSAIRDTELTKSWRSSPIIIDVVNRVFESIDHNPAIEGCDEVAAAWVASFKHHETARLELAGFAELTLGPSAKRQQARDELRFEQAAELVETLHQQRPDLSIGVLLRKNDSVARMRYELGPGRRNIPCGGRGEGSLIDAASVNVVLDALRMADHPDDTIAAFNVASSPLGILLEFTEFHDAGSRRRKAASIRRSLIDRGYAATIAGWIAGLSASCDARGLHRLNQLAQFAEGYDDRGALRPADFVRAAEITPIADAHPAQVQIMTIHQSKGLEFDIVVLPELESRLKGDHSPDVVYRRKGGTGPITDVCRYMNSQLRALAPAVQPLFDEHYSRTVRESLSLLYVAMTRARHALHFIVDPPSKPGADPRATLAGVVRAALGDGYVHGDPRWMDTLPVATRADPEGAQRETPIVVRLAPSKTKVAAAMSSPSALAAKDPALMLRLPDVDALDRGAAAHALFEQIEWIEDFEPDAGRLCAILERRFPRRDRRWVQEQVRAFTRMVRETEVRSVLARGDRSAELTKLWREHAFARLVNDGVQRGAIDRLEAEFDDTRRVVAARVIDFKTDLIEPLEAPGRAERYGPQLDAYRQAAAELLGIEAGQVRATLLFVAAGIAYPVM